jgi:hypothetical protein
VTFTVNCQPTAYYVYVTVTGDNYWASWEVSSSRASVSGTNNVVDEQLQIGGQTDTLSASITNSPTGYQCSISPSSESVTAGNSYTFTVTCQPYTVYVTVTGDTAGATWQVSSSIASISGTGNVNNKPLQILGSTDTLTATIQQIVSGNAGYWTCSISPTSVTVQAGQTITFNADCEYWTGVPP